MDALPPLTLRVHGRKLAGRLAFAVLLILSIAGGIGAGLLFVYWSDLPEVHALETFRPNVVTELYADDGQEIASSMARSNSSLETVAVPRFITTIPPSRAGKPPSPARGVHPRSPAPRPFAAGARGHRGPV